MNDSVIITFQRGKGGKQIPPFCIHKTLATAQALIEYLTQAHGNNRDNNALLWRSCSKMNKGKPIGTQAIAAVCEKYLGTSKVQTTRNTYLMMQGGAREI